MISVPRASWYDKLRCADNRYISIETAPAEQNKKCAKVTDHGLIISCVRLVDVAMQIDEWTHFGMTSSNEIVSNRNALRNTEAHTHTNASPQWQQINETNKMNWFILRFCHHTNHWWTVQQINNWIEWKLRADGRLSLHLIFIRLINLLIQWQFAILSSSPPFSIILCVFVTAVWVWISCAPRFRIHSICVSFIWRIHFGISVSKKKKNTLSFWWQQFGVSNGKLNSFIGRCHRCAYTLPSKGEFMRWCGCVSLCVCVCALCNFISSKLVLVRYVALKIQLFIHHQLHCSAAVCIWIRDTMHAPQSTHAQLA